MPDLTQVALTAARAFNPELADRAEKELKKYPKTKEGLQQVIAEYGGMAFVDSAVDFATKAPKVKALFDKFKVNPRTLKDNVMKELQTGNQPASTKQKGENSALSSLERLKKLR